MAQESPLAPKHHCSVFTGPEIEPWLSHLSDIRGQPTNVEPRGLHPVPGTPLTHRFDSVSGRIPCLLRTIINPVQLAMAVEERANDGMDSDQYPGSDLSISELFYALKVKLAQTTDSRYARSTIALQ